MKGRGGGDWEVGGRGEGGNGIWFEYFGKDEKLL